MFLCHIYKYCNPPFVVSCFYSTQKACPNCRNYTKCSRGSISDVGPEVVYILYYFCGITQTSGKVLQYCFKISYGIAARSRAVASHFVAFRNNYVLRCGAISRKIKPLQGSGRPMGCFSIWILPLTCPAREALPVASYGQYSLADLLFTCISISISEAFQAMKLRKHSQIN